MVTNGQLDAVHIMSNKFRYPKKDLDAKYSQQVPYIYPNSNQDSNLYRINRHIKKVDNIVSLDEEDKRLLNEFYEKQHHEPLIDYAYTSQSLWDDDYDKQSDSTLLTASGQQKSSRLVTSKYGLEQQKVTSPKQVEKMSDWTFDEQFIEQAEKLISPTENIFLKQPTKSANYAPSLRLLTIYNPLKNNKINEQRQIVEPKDQLESNLKLEPSRDAIGLHDELLDEPPRDGKVRVRMYFHRAIHDDINLYGNGPWKYWGHGWGVEFSYDPKKDTSKDFHQRGYTIEKAFGRDFCKDQKNCRPPDPNFFQTQVSAPKTNQIIN